jgi:Ca2+-binding EF-hand superfamily protein
LIKHHELAPKLAEVLSEIFDTFDKDHDGAQNNLSLQLMDLTLHRNSWFKLLKNLEERNAIG